jgi:cytochrome c biogenesis protein CcmG/thiol:disulfide interchange protein DsbE
MWRYLIPLALFAVLIGFFMRGLNLDPSHVPSPLIGKRVPDFTVANLYESGAPLRDEDLLGRVSLVNVWATWCAGCYDEHELLLELKREGAPPIYGIDWRDEREAALRWLAELGNPYEVVVADLDGRVAIDWGVYLAPETFLIGPDGTILHKHFGALTRAAWQRDFVPRIGEAERRPE